VCAVYSDHDEDSSHLFFECTKSVGCWQCVGLWLIIHQVWLTTSSCSTNVFSILQKFDGQQKQMFGVLLWRIWKHRNNKVWNNVTETNQHICERAEFFMSSWGNAQELRNLGATSSMQHEVAHWTELLEEEVEKEDNT